MTGAAGKVSEPSSRERWAHTNGQERRRGDAGRLLVEAASAGSLGGFLPERARQQEAHDGSSACRVRHTAGEVRRDGGKRTRRLKAELDGTEARLDNLAEAIAEGTPIHVLRAKLEAEDRRARQLCLEIKELEEAAAGPIQLPTNEDAIRLLFDLEQRLDEGSVEANREALRRLLLGGTIRLHADEAGIYTAHADVLIFGLVVGGTRRAASNGKTPDSEGDGRSTTVVCGGQI